MSTKDKALGWLLFVMMIFSVSTVATIGNLPDELTMSGSGMTSLSTLLPVSVEYREEQGDSAQARLFGVVNVKKMNVRRERPANVLLAGTLFGLKLYSDGVMVVGLSDFESNGAAVNPAREAGISRGDVIHRAGGKEIRTNAEFASAVMNSRGTLSLELTDSRGEARKVSVNPVRCDDDGCLKTGMWVRDSAAGIGTLTYIDPESGCFGGLGHGICDVDTHGIIPIHDGEIFPACVMGIKRGVRGSVGEIRGYLSGESIGVLRHNTQYGTFGQYTAELPELKAYEAAVKQEIRQGKAQILCTVTPDGKPRLYDAVIEKINYGGEPTRNMIIRVTDDALLEQTGGIIQGMSGSPVIQNGQFIGAVTHVFVNTPSRGYAIFAENMLGRD